MSRAEIELLGVTKRYAARARDDAQGPTLHGISLEVVRGEVLVVVGPSGCGKSTTLRIIAGLEEADAGVVRIGGRAMTNVSPEQRDVAMVFQGYALYPTMTVRENIEFPLRMRRIDSAERARRVDEVARMLGLGRLLSRLPSELSGGERQRVAMGRAIVRRPRVFLFDEPLSNLDAALRQELRMELGALLRELGATAIYVTHDQVEAMTLADRICVMNGGRVEQLSPPRAVYEEPATSFVATFIGAPKMTLLQGRVSGGVIECGPLRLPVPERRSLPGEVLVGVRSEDVRLVDAKALGATELEVLVSEPLGAETTFVLRAGEFELRARTPGFAPKARGSKVMVSVDEAKLHFFEAAGEGKRLA